MVLSPFYIQHCRFIEILCEVVNVHGSWHYNHLQQIMQTISEARFPFKWTQRRQLKRLRCVNEKRKQRKRLHWQPWLAASIEHSYWLALVFVAWKIELVLSLRFLKSGFHSNARKKIYLKVDTCIPATHLLHAYNNCLTNDVTVSQYTSQYSFF